MSLPLIFYRSGLSLPMLQALAGALTPVLVPGDVLTLSGGLGAGKTTFARALIAPLLLEPADVTSPTFNIMQSYDVMLASGRNTLWHLDLYRLKHPQEVHALGLEELWQYVTLIEWPQIIEAQLPASRLEFALEFDTEDTRRIRISGNDAWRKRLQSLE